ncbi:MAG: nucleotidyltransferase family protein [Nanoarchaeota archaeon]|nr:nucleotidyltransferase family protein [Nanoarchaeota archaeon]
MKAIILAGGEGTRLRPLTYKIPKALIPIRGKTLTEHVIDILKKYGANEIILSIAYKREAMKDYFKDGKEFNIGISYVEEPEPLGTAGPLIILNKQNKQLKETFFMVNGDNLFNVNLKEMLEFHKKNKATATIGLSRIEDPRSYGVAVLDGDKIAEFIEKPKDPPTNYINSGYYILEPEVFELIKDKEKAMIEKDIFPILAKQGKLYGFKCDNMWFDTGTPERLAKVRKLWKGPN